MLGSYTEKAMNSFGKYIVQQSRTRLTKGKHKDRGNLYKSLNYEYKQHPSSFEFTIEMEDYGDFVDKGVKGFSDSTKAPKSPYRFGSGKGKKGGFRKAIDGWVKRKGFLFRDKKSGRIMSRDTTSFLIRRSIWHTGLKTTDFFSKPFERAFKRLPEDIVESYGLDVDKWLIEVMKK